MSRAWELALGGLVFIISYKHKNIFDLLNKYKNLGFFISIAISYNNTSFSTFKTFIIVFFSAYLMINQKQYFQIVFIGLISFPLYLWHYVIISYTHIFGLEIDMNIGIFLIFISVFLSYLTYRYIEIYARAKISYIFALGLFTVVLSLGILGNYVSKKDGLPNRTHLKSNEKQFIRTPAQNNLGISLLTKVLGYKPTNDYIKSTSDDMTKKYVLVMGDSHAHTSYHGFSEEFKKYGYETILLANSSCPTYLGGAMGKTISELNICKEKIENIYKLLNTNLNIEKIILSTRMGYMYDMGFGEIDGGNKPYNYHFESFFEYNKNYSQKQTFFEVVENTFIYFNSNKKIKFYYLMENPELGFSPKNCMIRPFDLFINNCRLTLDSYLNRAGEYRNFIYKLSQKYKYS